MLRAAVVLLLLATVAGAQVPREGEPSALPLAPEDLPNGQSISRPIQPVSVTESVSVEPTAQYDPDVLPQWWLSADYLLAWTPSDKLPPLVTANRFGPPVLGAPNTVTRFSGTQPRGEFHGLRTVLGARVPGSAVWGVELGYQFLGSKTVENTFGRGGVNQEAYLGRPLVNARTGTEDVVLIYHPRMHGDLTVSRTLRAQGWEAVATRELTAWSGPFTAYRLSALAGYRHFLVNDGLRFDQRAEFADAAGVVYRSSATDQIDARNSFHGGTLGLRTDVRFLGMFAEVGGRVSFGATREVVRVSGQTVATAGNDASFFPSAVFGQPSNIGQRERTVFAVLPEANVRVGVFLREHFRLSVGYTFTYLSDVVRAADQLDRVVDLTQSAGGVGDRPRVPFTRSDFWVQGVTVGLEWRY